jgi:cytochrome b subunit of formate dehydrogenase
MTSAAVRWLVLIAVLAAASTARAEAGEGRGAPVESCLACHRERAGKAAAVDESGIKRSVHGKLACTACHADLAGARVGALHPRSAAVSRQLAPRMCARCHGAREGSAGERYLRGAHGLRLVGRGLLVAASCLDCHGAHEVTPGAAIDRRELTAVCGRCHRGALAGWRAGVHATGGPRWGKTTPSCLDCHRTHDNLEIDSPGWRAEAGRRCGECHAAERERYRASFHGKALDLQHRRAAGCPDCHGSHPIRSLAADGSPTAGLSRIETCRTCHPGANAAFATYMPHPDVHDRARHGAIYWARLLLIVLLVGVFAFFGVHSVLWLVRSLVFRRTSPEVFRAERERAHKQGAGKIYARFRPIDRYCHVLMMCAFVLLVATGMPLRYHDHDFARRWVQALGGIDLLRVLHRLGAILAFVSFGMHLYGLGAALYHNRQRVVDEQGRVSLRALLRFAFGPDSPAPNRQDFRDCWAHQKWFLGRGPRPQFDRWTYWEKFDYAAVFWGMALMGISGLMLWFPRGAAFFVPGWLINVAAVVHSSEALLAVGFVVLFHFFNVHLRVDKFPLDTSIFTGRISEEEMLTERRRLYERLQADGRLAEERRRAATSPVRILWLAVVVVSMLAVFWNLAARLTG